MRESWKFKCTNCEEVILATISQPGEKESCIHCGDEQIVPATDISGSEIRVGHIVEKHVPTEVSGQPPSKEVVVAAKICFTLLALVLFLLHVRARMSTDLPAITLYILNTPTLKYILFKIVMNAAFYVAFPCGVFTTWYPFWIEGRKMSSPGFYPVKQILLVGWVVPAILMFEALILFARLIDR